MALPQKQLDEFVNERVGENVRILPNVLGELKKERDQLLLALSGGGEHTGTGSSEWEWVAGDVRSTITDLEHLQNKLTPFLSSREEGEEGRGGTLLQPQAVKVAGGINHLVSELIEGEKLRKYLCWVKRSRQLSCRVEEKVAVGAMDEAVEAFRELWELSEKLRRSRCVHLLSFVSCRCELRRMQLKERLTSIFSELLKAMGWPLITTTSASAVAAQTHKKTEFTACFKQLLVLDTSPHPTADGVPQLMDAILLPIELMLEPLRKRFRFHFYGKKKTNSPEKPEWFFTQVSTWISSHAHFLNSHAQPALQETSFNHVDAKTEFVRGLLQEVEKRLHHQIFPAGDSPSNEEPIIDDDYLMSHLVDELLLFEQELRSVHHYPSFHPSCVDVLLEDAPLCRWLNLEKQFAVEKLKAITDSSTAWQPQYAAVQDEDETRVPECAEHLMNLIAGITERYRQIPILYLRLRFLELQTDLLLEFHQDLTSTVTSSSSHPISQQFIAYLNASCYITSVLKGWGEQTFFLELSYYSQHISSPTRTPVAVGQLEALRRLDPDFAKLEGTAFDTVIAAFSSLTTDMLEIVSTHVTTSLHSSLAPYQNNKWHNLPAVKDPLQQEVSSSFLVLLGSLQEQLLVISTHISRLLLPQLITELCTLIDSLIFSKVVLLSHFSEGGASQLYFDLSKALVPLLARYTDVGSQSLLVRSLEASRLLQQLPGSLELLSGYLKSALAGDGEAVTPATAALEDMGLHTLSLREADSIVKRRVFI